MHSYQPLKLPQLIHFFWLSLNPDFQNDPSPYKYPKSELKDVGLPNQIIILTIS